MLRKTSPRTSPVADRWETAEHPQLLQVYDILLSPASLLEKFPFAASLRYCKRAGSRESVRKLTSIMH